MKKSYVLFAAVIAFLLGMAVCCLCKCCKSQIAVIDVAVVANHSEMVSALKEEHSAKAQELAQWLENAKSEIEKEKDKAKQEALVKKYNEEFAQRRQEIAKAYSEQLKQIDESITATISELAKKKGYKLVIAKNLAIYGGKDITEEVSALVK